MFLAEGQEDGWKYRKKGIASEMITFAEDYCIQNYPLHKYELLTGTENSIAQSVYGKLGYTDDDEQRKEKFYAFTGKIL